MPKTPFNQKKYREILVAPLAARREALSLIAAIGFIILLMSVRFSLLESKKNIQEPQPYQLLDLGLKNQAPTLYRTLLAAAGDILYLREENGSWPEVSQLHNEDLPPFADSSLPPGLRGLTWERHLSTGAVDYLCYTRDIAQKTEQGNDPLKQSFILRILDLKNSQHPYPSCRQSPETTSRFSTQVWINPQVAGYPADSLKKHGWKWIVNANSMKNCEVIERSGM